MKLTSRGERAKTYLRHYFQARVDEHEPPASFSKDKFAHVATCQIFLMPSEKLPCHAGETQHQARMRLEVAVRERELRDKLSWRWELLRDYFTPSKKTGKTPTLRRMASKYYYHYTHIGRVVVQSLNEAGDILFKK